MPRRPRRSSTASRASGRPARPVEPSMTVRARPTRSRRTGPSTSSIARRPTAERPNPPSTRSRVRRGERRDGPGGGASALLGPSGCARMKSMPLSDEEQKILREIEANLNATDPALGERVARTTLYRHSARMIRWAALGLLGGLILLIFTFASSVWVGAIGFAVMLG